MRSNLAWSKLNMRATFARKVNEPLSEKYKEKADRIAKNPKYTFERLRPKNIEKYTEDFRIIYNKAWVKHKGVNEMSSSSVRSS